MSIRPGIYKLSHDVKNPQGDARFKYDWTRRPAFKAGMRFVVEEDAHRKALMEKLVKEHNLDPKSVEIETLFTVRPEKGATPHQVSCDKGLGLALFSALEPADRTLTSVLHGELGGGDGWDTRDILQALLDAGKITLDDIHEAGKTAWGE